MVYHHERIEGRIAMPSPLRDLHEDRVRRHCLHLRATQENIGVRNNFLVGNLAKQLNVVIITSTISVYSKNGEHAKIGMKVHFNVF